VLSDDTYEDLGISAFRGKNAAEGALGAFLAAVDAGQIDASAHLLVESLDRVSRNKVNDALALFLSIIDRGITVVSLIDQQVYSQETISKDRGIGLIISITQFIRSHEESATKSTRIKAAWDQKRNTGQILTTVCPAWIRYDKTNNRFELIPDKAEVIRRIFDSAISGKGTPTIARELNQTNTPTLGTAIEWSAALVAHVLHNRSVYGLYYPKKASASEIQDYYPPVISQDQYDHCQAIIDGRNRNRTGGNREDVQNIFAGLVYCGECGSKYRYVSKKGKERYLQCTTAYNTGKCKALSISYTPLKTAVIHDILYFPEIDDYKELDNSEHQKLLNALGDVKSQITKLTALLGVLDDPSPIISQISGLQRQQKQIERDIAKPRKIPVAQSILDLRKQAEITRNEDTPDNRRKLQSIIRLVIDRIYIHPGIDYDDGNEMYYRMAWFTGPVVDEINSNKSTGIACRIHLPQWGIKDSNRSNQYQAIANKDDIAYVIENHPKWVKYIK
jgi:DNA invertase Pin-like site-specific DNA recombinase